MPRACILYAALLLSVATLQLQSANGSPLTWNDDPVRMQVPLSASALIEDAKTFVQVRSSNDCPFFCGYYYVCITFTDWSAESKGEEYV